MLFKLFPTRYLFSLLLVCCLITNCGQQNSGLQKTVNPELVIQLPKPGSPMSTPFPVPITPYDNLSDSDVTPEWNILITNAGIYQGTIPPINSEVNATLQIKNKQEQSVSFTCEAFIYEAETQRKIPINLSVVNSKKEKISFTIKAKSIRKLELFTREAPPFMGNTTKWWTTFMLVIKLTDDANHSVRLRASKLKINTAQ